jgi:hypothetical protein
MIELQTSVKQDDTTRTRTPKPGYLNLSIILNPHAELYTYPTSFPGLSCEDEGRDEKALVWAGHVATRKMAVFDSYSSRSGEIFFNEIYKSSKQINSQKTSQSILYIYV